MIFSRMRTIRAIRLCVLGSTFLDDKPIFKSVNATCWHQRRRCLTLVNIDALLCFAVYATTDWEVQSVCSVFGNQLGDLGSGRVLLNMSDTFVGTSMFMAPEVLYGETYSKECDIYSLGSVLYMLCAGKPAYVSAKNVFELKVCLYCCGYCKFRRAWGFGKSRLPHFLTWTNVLPYQWVLRAAKKIASLA